MVLWAGPNRLASSASEVCVWAVPGVVARPSLSTALGWDEAAKSSSESAKECPKELG